MAENFEGYRIHTGFLGGNLTNESGLDLRESCYRYAKMLREALEAEYPGAEVTVDYQVNASGSLPRPLETMVTLPGASGLPGSDEDLERMQAEEDLIQSVDEIAGRVWESWDWAVYEEARG